MAGRCHVVLTLHDWIQLHGSRPLILEKYFASGPQVPDQPIQAQLGVHPEILLWMDIGRCWVEAMTKVVLSPLGDLLPYRILAHCRISWNVALLPVEGSAWPRFGEHESFRNDEEWVPETRCMSIRCMNGQINTVDIPKTTCVVESPLPWLDVTLGTTSFLHECVLEHSWESRESRRRNLRVPKGTLRFVAE